MGMPRPNFKSEADKRREAQARWNAEQFAQLYSRKAAYPRHGWYRVDGADIDEETKDQDQPMLRSAGNGSKKFSSGLYKFSDGPDKDSKENFHIRYKKERDGSFSVSAVPPRIWRDGSCCSAMMDFLATTQGTSTITFSLSPGSPADSRSLKHYKKKMVLIAIKQAAKKGLALEFDQGTKAFIDTLPVKDQQRLLDAERLLKVNQLKADILVGGSRKAGREFRSDAEALKEMPKLDDKVTHDQLKKDLFKDDKGKVLEDNDKILEAADKQFKTIQERMSGAQDKTARASSGLIAQAQILDKPDEISRASRLADRKFAKAFREGKDSYVRGMAAIKEIEDMHNESRPAKEALINALDGEVKNLDKHQTILTEKVTEIRDKLKAVDSKTPEQQAQLDKAEKLLTAFEKNKTDKLEKASEEVKDLKSVFDSMDQRIEVAKSEVAAQQRPGARS